MYIQTSHSCKPAKGLRVFLLANAFPVTFCDGNVAASVVSGFLVDLFVVQCSNDKTLLRCTPLWQLYWINLGTLVVLF